jgi:ribosome-associated protein
LGNHVGGARRCSPARLDIVIRITNTISLEERELEFSFVRSSGPGGQHVNKVATAAQLRFDAGGSPNLPEEVRRRLVRLAGSRINAEGVILISARRFRSQGRNRQDALDRLAALIRTAEARPKRRKKTRRTRASVERRLGSKRKRSETKRLRGRPGE